MKTAALLPLLAAMSLGVNVPAQDDHSTSATLIVRFGAGDLVLNEPLLAAIVGDPKLVASIRKIAGDGLSKYNGISVSCEAAHLPGTFQVAFTVGWLGTGQWPRETLDAITDAVAEHVQSRLDTMLYQEPRALLEERRAELAKRHEQLAREQATLRARSGHADADLEAAQKLRAEVEHGLLTTRLDVATEQRVNTFLDKARSELVDRREMLRQQRAALGIDHARVERELSALNRSLADLPAALAGGKASPEQLAELAKVRKECDTLQERLADGSREQQRLTDATTDIQELLTRNLEQFPASTLALQRASARFEVLDGEAKHLDALVQKAAAAQQEAAEWAARAELLRIDIEVCRSQLVEVQGKLGRLEPVRFQLLRQG